MGWDLPLTIDRFGENSQAPRSYGFFGTSLTRPSVAQELAVQIIGVKSFELPGSPLGVDRETIGQLPSAFWVATRKSIPRRISRRSAVKPASDNAYKVWPVAKASLVNSGTVWLQPPSARCRASSSSIVVCSAVRGLPERTPRSTFRSLSWWRSERLAAPSQTTAFASASRCDSGASGPDCPWSAMMIQAASVVWLSLIGGRRRVAKNSHEPSGCCFLTISSAISLRLCFCPSFNQGNDRAATARNGSPMFSPRPWGRGSGGSAGSGKIFEASSLSLLPSSDSTVSVKYF